MSLTTIAVIAQLCLIPNGRNFQSSLDDVYAEQLKCQKAYIKCVKEAKHFTDDSALQQCVEEKK